MHCYAGVEISLQAFKVVYHKYKQLYTMQFPPVIEAVMPILLQLQCCSALYYTSSYGSGKEGAPTATSPTVYNMHNLSFIMMTTVDR